MSACEEINYVYSQLFYNLFLEIQFRDCVRSSNHKYHLSVFGSVVNDCMFLAQYNKLLLFERRVWKLLFYLILYKNARNLFHL